MRLENLILPILLIVLAIGSFFFYTQPAYNEMQELQASIGDYEEALSNVQEAQRLRDSLLAEYNQISEDQRYRMANILPPEFDQVLFSLELDRLASQSGLTVEEVSASPASGGEEQAAASVRPVEVSFSITASYEEALVFARNVERSARVIDINSISVGGGPTAEQGEESEETPLVGEQNSYQFSGTTYWMPGQL